MVSSAKLLLALGYTTRKELRIQASYRPLWEVGKQEIAVINCHRVVEDNNVVADRVFMLRAERLVTGATTDGRGGNQEVVAWSKRAYRTLIILMWAGSQLMCKAEGDGTGGATPNNGLCVSTWGPVTNLAILAVMRADRVRVEGAAFFVTVVAVIRRFISTVFPKST